MRLRPYWWRWEVPDCPRRCWCRQKIAYQCVYGTSSRYNTEWPVPRFPPDHTVEPVGMLNAKPVHEYTR